MLDIAKLSTGLTAMGAAVAVVIFACVAVVTFVQFLGQRRWVNYV